MLKWILVCTSLLTIACNGEFKTSSGQSENRSFDGVNLPDDFEEPDSGSLIGDGNMDGEIIEIPIFNNKNTFYFEDQVFALAHNSALRWDGCSEERPSMGGYNSQTQCGKAFIAPEFSVYLNEYFYECIQRGVEVSSLPAPKRIFINHLGSYNDRNARNSTQLSHHAYARALDISYINLFDINDQHYQISTLRQDYLGDQAKFYDEFRQCWKEKMPETCDSSQREFKGSIGHTLSALGGNDLHNDHIHLVLPLCADEESLELSKLNSSENQSRRRDLASQRESLETSEESLRLEVLKQFKSSEEVDVVIALRKGGHVLGQDQMLEVRANCSKLKSGVSTWPVVSSFSACLLDTEHLKINSEQTALAIAIKLADHSAYYEQVAEGNADPEILCQKASQVRIIPLTRLCPN